MTIDFNNYEEWAMDYIEGRLPSDIRSSFDLFLAQNPDIRANVDSLTAEMPTLKCSTIIYPDKDSLMSGGKTLTLKACVHYLSGAAVAAVVMFGLFMLTEQREKFSMPVAEVVHTTPTHTTQNRAQNRAQNEVETIKPLPAIENRGTREREIVKSMAQAADANKENNTTKEELELNDKILLASTEFEAIGEQYNVVRGSIDLSAPATLAYISDVEMTHAKVEESFSDNLRQSLASLIAPIDRLSPIKTYQTATGHGIEIASRYRIGR